MNQSNGSSVQTEISPHENIRSYTKRHTDIMLGCFVVGEDKAFIIEADRIKTISQLRDTIKAYKENVFKTFDANQITLWKVDIPGKEDTKTRTQMKKAEPEKRRNKHVPKALASFLTSPTPQSHATNIHYHKFYDRDQAQHLMLEVACSNYEGRENSDHKAHKFTLIPGGIGIGKTRMGWESNHLSSALTLGSTDTYDNKFVEALKSPCYIFVDLNNGCQYLEGFDDKQDASVRIGARIALSSGFVHHSRLSALMSEVTDDIRLFSLSNVIYEILKCLIKKDQKDQCPLAIIIHLDEYQLYIDDIVKYQQRSWMMAREFFKLMLKEIGSVMRGQYDDKMKEEYYGKYFIIPICTGTSAIDVQFLSTEYPRELVEFKPLNYESAKSMFLDKYEYSMQTTDERRDLVIQGLKLHHSSDLNNEDIEKLSADFCKFVLNQQHFQIAMSDTGFIPKLIDDLLSPPILTSYFDWGNQLFAKIFQRKTAKIGNNPGDWKDLDDIRTVISFGLTRQLIKREFRLKSGISIGELERSGLIYLSNTNDEWYTIVMPFMLLKVLNNKLLVSNVEPVFQDNLLLIPTYDSPWQWQNFELLYGHFQKALIDSLIYVQESRINSVNYEIHKLRLQLEEQKDYDEKIKISRKIDSLKEELDHQERNNWKLSDIFRGALGADTLLQRKVRLHSLKVFTENDKFLVETDDVASFDNSVLCDDNVTRSLEEGIFRCCQGNANIDHHWILDSADNEKKLAIFSQIKYSERGVTTKMSTPNIKDWYDITMKSVENYKNDYDVILVLFTNRKCTGKINIETMPHLLLIYPKNLEKYLSPTFAHRGLVDRPSEK
ncbi:10024_t:CDS:2 [Funneliformis caledonium]|uniref:10024_t:CDS:1 n=1 Tax=Funneliformis caledonium TaxID=1117310 RepID=A0A9N9DHQ8_9GLOM|nr:10024_t:CDS:2 [Funneliformis caledonium]